MLHMTIYLGEGTEARESGGDCEGGEVCEGDECVDRSDGGDGSSSWDGGRGYDGSTSCILRKQAAEVVLVVYGRRWWFRWRLCCRRDGGGKNDPSSWGILVGFLLGGIKVSLLLYLITALKVLVLFPWQGDICCCNSCH
jgi:hypothetical protein